MFKRALLLLTIYFASCNNQNITDYEDDGSNIQGANGRINKGSLTNGVQLPKDGLGYYGTPSKRSRQFATKQMINTIIYASTKLMQKYPNTTCGNKNESDRLMIGELSRKHGGFLSGHASHQNGLDADISLFNCDGKKAEKHFTYSNPSSIFEAFRRTKPNKSSFDVKRTIAFLDYIKEGAQKNCSSLKLVIIDFSFIQLLRLQLKATGLVKTIGSYHFLKLGNHKQHIHFRLAKKRKNCTIPSIENLLGSNSQVAQTTSKKTAPQTTQGAGVECSISSDLANFKIIAEKLNQRSASNNQSTLCGEPLNYNTQLRIDPNSLYRGYYSICRSQQSAEVQNLMTKCNKAYVYSDYIHSLL